MPRFSPIGRERPYFTGQGGAIRQQYEARFEDNRKLQAAKPRLNSHLTPSAFLPANLPLSLLPYLAEYLWIALADSAIFSAREEL